jgi:FlaA1/EpsC-like NDP-sugar epimerase
VKNFVLISTDKAVRPTNVMGASKRIAEMIVQSITNDRIKFSIVRFGNVLGSSGSVIPLFSKQISSGGPVTVTHKNITRYFMTIAEAVELVIQAGSLEDSSLIYLLDMGKPIPIDQLARDMIILSGLKVKEGNYGDIEIKYTGLRPGEKMYEELLINNNVIKTKHPRIFAAREQFVNVKIIEEFIHVIEEKLDSSTPEEIKKQLIPIVEDYSPNYLNQK